VEETELYYFHRNGLSTKYGTRNTFRRNYFNSRFYGDVPQGRRSGTPDRGDTALTLYPGSAHLLENNLSEGNAAAWDIPAITPAGRNRVLGQISLKDNHGGILHARGTGASMMPYDNLVQDFVVITPTFTGLYARGAKNTRCVNCSVFNAQSGLVADIQANQPGDGAPSFYAENVLVVQSRRVGIRVTKQADWGVDYPNVYGSSPAFMPEDGHVTHAKTIEPGLGTCKLWIPENSPMKRAGKGGADIGANVYFRYEHGVLTKQPLWDPRTGAFPCGALVAGGNDVPGASCRDVHQRLGVGAEGCTAPLSGPPPSPQPSIPPSPSNGRLAR
jgi:hypothetical protein